jgi:hypothetical protein
MISEPRYINMQLGLFSCACASKIQMYTTYICGSHKYDDISKNNLPKEHDEIGNSNVPRE